MLGSVAALDQAAVVQSAARPGVGAHVRQVLLGVVVDIAFAVGNEEVAVVAVRGTPRVAGDPALEVVVEPHQQHDVAAIVRGVGRLLVGCAAMPGEEIVVDIKTTGDGADGVEPDLLIRHVAQVGVASDARGAADAVHGGIVGVRPRTYSSPDRPRRS